MKKLIFILIGLFIYINSFSQQTYYEFYPTKICYYNKATNYTWQFGSGDLQENVKISYFVNERLFIIKNRDNPSLTPEIHKIIDVTRTKTGISLLSSELYVIHIKDFVTHTEIFVWNPAEHTPPGSKESIMFTTGRRYIVPQ
jgi:hypothetical protein